VLRLKAAKARILYSSVAEDENHVRLVTALKSGRVIVGNSIRLAKRLACYAINKVASVGGLFLIVPKNASASTTAHPTMTKEATAPAVILVFLSSCNRACDAFFKGGAQAAPARREPMLRFRRYGILRRGALQQTLK
jgi:hypothetical protein